MKNYLKTALPILPALMMFGWLANKFWFIQDDAYISYRYVANFLNGHGLVYNIGERIEGFTNFGWVIYLILAGAMKLDFILVSRLTGLAFGAGLIILTYALARHLFARKDFWLALLPVYLVAANPGLAYWSPAGLETTCFAFTTLAALYCYLRRSRWLPLWLMVSVWVRPEGALVAGMLVLIEAITERRLPRFTGRAVILALILSLPFALFKVIYYGSIFPNPFFAKTGARLDYLTAGFEYAGKFFADCGFYGLGLLLPLIFWNRMSRAFRAVWLFVILYVLYIVVVGGDVLKVYRFFVPLFGGVALLTALSLRLVAENLAPKTRNMVYFLVGVPLLAATVWLPWNHVNTYNTNEKLFTRKMQFMGQQMRQADSTDFSVAVPTIGIFGYELLGHEVIDMLGLTDSTIARHSEPPIAGMTTTWKERKHNTKYLLTRAPDYIVFSTGVKPSAPAERALLLFPEFLNAYRTVGWYYQVDPMATGSIVSAFKRVREIKGSLVPTYPVEYVQHYKTALDAYVGGDQKRAIEYYAKALKASPKPYNPYVIYQKAFSHLLLNDQGPALRLLDRVLAQDSMVFEAHKDLYFIAAVSGDIARVAIHERWLRKLVPWYWPKIHSDAVKARADLLARQRGQ
ncbi:MAG: hypothetical protein KAW46_08955 [candidate division Zixibacteria bacterium]|nr:hypothetical protein [candidate division Zixibacteria bacterium]